MYAWSLLPIIWKNYKKVTKNANSKIFFWKIHWTKVVKLLTHFEHNFSILKSSHFLLQKNNILLQETNFYYTVKPIHLVLTARVIYDLAF